MPPRVPTSLLDGGAWLRIASGNAKCPHRNGVVRQMQAAAHALASAPVTDEFASSPVPTHGRRKRRSTGSLAVRVPEASGSNTAVTELQKRFSALDEVIQEEVEMAPTSASEPSEFSEDELLGFYEDVLSLPQESAASTSAIAAPQASTDDVSRVQALADTLAPTTPAVSETDSSSTSLLETLQKRLDPSSALSQVQHLSKTRDFPELLALPAYQRVIYRLKQTVPELVQIRQKAESDAVPIVLLTEADWKALVQTCVKHEDIKSAEDVLGLMQALEGEKAGELATDVMEFYAERGDVMNAERLLHAYQIGLPTERQRDVHIQAHLHATPRNIMPESALAVLHQYETRNVPAPMSTYTGVITHLFNEARSSAATAQAWDLYGHMRYVAHPQPDAALYATMIRACAPVNGQPEPERALDLFTEMTVDNGVEPTQAVYNAVILACARSGSQSYVTEAFRIARQMLDARKDARGQAQFRANIDTFTALLEGAKRRGDLARTRWILAELVAEVARAAEGKAPAVSVSDETMVHVFHAYAAYRPPRVQLRSVPDAPAGESTPTPSPSSAKQVAAQDPGPSSAPVKNQSGESRSHLPPQSRAEVLREAKAIFERIVSESKAGSGPLSTVKLTPKLIDAYLAVHYVHANLANASALFDTIFAEHGVRRGPRALVNALERCATSKTGEDREAAVTFAAKLWPEWENVEMEGFRKGKALNPRLVEQAHVARIRVHALANDIPRSLDSIRSFVARYPPSNARVPALQPDYRSPRVRLHAARPLVRLTSATDVADDTVPPQLTWPDLDVVHHRCVVAGRADGVRYIKWVCHAYRGAVKVRREKFLGVEGDIRRREREKEKEEREVRDIVQGSMTA
ncbi:unnamed protein product [Peniophora sp. CBMAI 1063]|nr:unnamed protein product [Peniophora sp. CBMAI 1063]